MNNKNENNDNMKKPPPVASAAAAVASSTTNKNDGNDATLAQALQAVESLVQLFGFSYDAANDAVNAVGVDLTSCYNYILDNGLGTDQGGAIYPIEPCVHVHQSLLEQQQQQQNRKEATTKNNNDDANKSNLMSRLLLLSTNDQQQQQMDDDIKIKLRKDLFETPCMYHHQQQQKQHPAKKIDDNATKGRLKSDSEYDDNNDTTSSSSSNCPMGENWICLQCGLILCSRYINGHGVRHWEDYRQQQQQQQQQHCVAISLADLSVWCHECQSYIKTEQPPLKSLMSKLEEIKFSS